MDKTNAAATNTTEVSNMRRISLEAMPTDERVIDSLGSSHRPRTALVRRATCQPSVRRDGRSHQCHQAIAETR